MGVNAVPEKLPVLCLMGPTAAGKTGLALQLVQQLPVDIISVDSVQVYRGMDIGSAKPSAQELALAPHRLIDICDPADAYSAARFADDAQREIHSIHAAGRIPLLVGGTRLYFMALLQGLNDLPKADAALRAELTEQAATLGWPAMHARLAQVDATTAARLHPNDAQRIQRALEIHQLTGHSASWHYARQAPTPPWPVLKFAIAPSERAVLRERISQRLQAMVQAGFVGEVQALYARGDLTAELPAVRAVGYLQLWDHVAGNCSLDEAMLKAVHATGQLARRQLIWLRREPQLQWLEGNKLDAESTSAQVIQTVKNKFPWAAAYKP